MTGFYLSVHVEVSDENRCWPVSSAVNEQRCMRAADAMSWRERCRCFADAWERDVIATGHL